MLMLPRLQNLTQRRKQICFGLTPTTRPTRTCEPQTRRVQTEIVDKIYIYMINDKYELFEGKCVQKDSKRQ